MGVADRDAAKTLGNMPLDRLCKRFLRRCGRHRQRVIVQAGSHQKGHRLKVAESPLLSDSRELRRYRCARSKSRSQENYGSYCYGRQPMGINPETNREGDRPFGRI